MGKHNKRNKKSLKLSDGGKVSVFTSGSTTVIVVEHGYKETPEERKNRIANGPKSSVIPNKKHKKGKGGRRGEKSSSIKDSL